MISEAEESIMKEMNSSRREIVSENNGILKATASESYSKEVNDTEREDRSIWEDKKDTITKITSVDQLDKMHSSRDELKCKESKREIKNPGKNVVITAGKPCTRQRPFCNIVGNQEQRRDELEKMEDDLRKRLDILECSMPAVMVWNILKMSQGTPVCSIGRILEKQLKRAKEISCRSTPSCHYDCRVREIEAERKLALKKTEEARTLWLEKRTTLEKRKKELEKARRIQEEQKSAIDRLNEEAKALREAKEKKAMEVNESCHGEVSSVTSIESEDIQCLEKLQQLAEDEVIIKRGIAELERREETYMKTLQQADELWSKMEGDGICTTSALQEQLDTKTAANQQLAARVCELEDALENCQAKLAACKTELEKYLSIEKLEAMIGREDDVAEVTDRAVAVKARVVHRPIGREDDVAIVKDDEVLARVEVVDEEALAIVELVDEEALAKVEIIDEEVLAKVEVIDEEELAKVEVMDEEALAKVEIVDEEALVKVEVVDEEILAEVEEVDEKALEIVELMDEETLARIELADLAIDRPVDLVQIEDVEIIVRPEDIINDQLEAEKVREYLAKLDSLEELYKEGEPCDPDFVCNDVVTSPTGMTDEELIALGIDPKKFVKKLVAREEEDDRILPEELAKEDVIEDVEENERKEKKNFVKIEPDEVADDKLVTIPIDVRELEVEKIKPDQDIVIPRDTILSWIDMIDTIRTSAAKHPDCYEVKKDADVLIEQVGAHVGIKPKEVEEEKIITITENKLEEVIEENEIKVNESVIIETKLPDELIVPTNRKLEPPTKNESIPVIPSLRIEEIPVEVKAPTEPVAELQPTKEEISVDVEPPTTVSIENSFEYPTIPVKEDLLVPNAVPNSKPVPYEIEIEKIEIEEAEEEIVKEIVDITKEVEIPQVDKVEENAVFEDLIDKELAIEKVINDKIMEPTEEEQILIAEKIEKKEEEIVPEEEKRDEEEVEDVPIKEVIEKENAVEEKVDERLPVSEEIDESKYVEDVEIIPEIVSPAEDLVEVEKIERELLIVDAEEVPISDRVSDKITINESLPSAKEPSITDVIPKEIKKVPTNRDIREIIEEKEEIEAIEDIEIQPSVPEAIEDIKTPIQPSVPEVEIEKEISDRKIKEIPDVVTPSMKFFEKIEEEKEMPSVEKEKISAKIALPTKEEKKIELINAELKIETKPAEIEIPIIPIDPRLLLQPYLIIAKIKERELMQAAPTMKLPSKIVDNEIVKTDIIETEIVETELVGITTQTISVEPRRMPSTPVISEYLKPAEMKAPYTKFTDDRPEITGRKMPSYKRLKDQSTVTTNSAGSQTDKTSRVSHDRVVRDERARVTADELLRSIKIAAKLARPDAEREIRTINYGGRSDEMRGKVTCNCCQCGKISTPPSARPRMKVQPQIDAVKTPTPPAAVFRHTFTPPKSDRPISYDRLCPDCIAKIQSKMMREKYHIEKTSRDQASCGCSSLDKPCCTGPRKREIEKKDQGSLVKMPKRKTNFVEQKRKDDLQSILEDPEKIDIEPLSPSCICYKSGKISPGPMRKGNCYCGD
ncbi:hypothetical protein ACFW04_006492 [Cataglyphis niger]